MKYIALLLLLPSLSFAKAFIPDSFSANFVQTVKSSATGKDNKTLGKVDYKYPGHLRFEVTDPVKSLVIINPDKTWNIQFSTVKTEKDQVNVSKTSDFPLIKFFDSVKNGLVNSKQFTTKYEKNDVVLTFDKSIQKEFGYESITLHSVSNAKDVKELKDFESITINRLKASPTKFTFSDFRENSNLKSDLFVFKPSANSKIIEN